MLGYILIAVFAAAVLAYLFYPPFRDWVRGKKTLATAGGVSVLGFLQQFDLAQIVDKAYIGYWLLGIGIAFAILRTMTNAPMR